MGFLYRSSAQWRPTVRAFFHEHAHEYGDKEMVAKFYEKYGSVPSISMFRYLRNKLHRGGFLDS